MAAPTTPAPDATVAPAPPPASPAPPPAEPTLRQRLLKPWIVMPTLGVVVLAAFFVVRNRDDGGGGASTVPAEQVVEATTGSMALTVTAEGTLVAAHTDDLTFGAAGTVTAVNVDAGDEVQEGDVLAVIDSPELELAVADAESAVADAQTTLDDDVSSGASDAQIAADTTSLEAAEDDLAAAQEALDGAQLTATFDGTVAQVNVTVGDELGSGGSGGTDATGTGSGSGQSASTLGDSSSQVGASGVPGAGGGQDATSSGTDSTPDVQVVDTTHFTVDLGLDETEVANVVVGQTASATPTTSSSSDTVTFGFPGGGSFPGGGTFPGAPTGAVPSDATGGSGQATTDGSGASDDATTDDATTDDATAVSADPVADGLVWEVSQVADASSGVATYPVTVVFEGDSGELIAGQTVSVDITYAERDDVVEVPSLAVTTASDGTSTVTVRTDDGDETRTVTTGLTQDGMVEITDGLAAGEQVVVSFPSFGGGPGGDGGGDQAPTGELPSGGQFQLPGAATGAQGG